jgi:hypothetical protein
VNALAQSRPDREDQAISPKPPPKSRFLSRLFPPPLSSPFLPFGPGWGYRRNGFNFDGYDQGKLIDAKYYPEANSMTKTLARNSYWAGTHHLGVAAKQLSLKGQLAFR